MSSQKDNTIGIIVIIIIAALVYSDYRKAGSNEYDRQQSGQRRSIPQRFLKKTENKCKNCFFEEDGVCNCKGYVSLECECKR